MRDSLGVGLLAVLLLAACVPAATPGTSPAGTASPSATQAARVPAPVAVTIDPAKSAFLVLDLTAATCNPRRTCVASLPAVATLLQRARDAKVLVVYSDTTGNPAIREEVAQRQGEPKVTGRADKFVGTNLDQILKQAGIETVVIVGTAANGAVLYTAFGANVRGYTAVVAEDGISEDDPWVVYATKWQLLKQPGFANAENKPLEKARVTLSRTDLIGFAAPPSGTSTPAAAAEPPAPRLRALSAVAVPAKTTAVLALDLIDPTCGQRPQCVGSLPKVADLLKRAREAKSPVLYTITTAQGVSIRSEVAPLSGERLVTGSADKFFGTNLDQNLKNDGVDTVILVGTAAHGAVLYTAFGATLRGYTVVVAEDGISVGPGDELGLSFAKWQVLNQPGLNNPENLPLTKGRVTLSRSDVITFK